MVLDYVGIYVMYTIIIGQASSWRTGRYPNGIIIIATEKNKRKKVWPPVVFINVIWNARFLLLDS